MEPSELSTHLPPRKRLLAGFRTAAAASSDASEQSPQLVLPDDLAARLRGMMGPPTATPPPSPEEIIRAARRAYSAAADAAAAARAAAEDKAAVAAKARAAARAAMELLDSLSVSRSRNGIQLKAKSRKKHVQVKLLYRPPGHRSPGPQTVDDDDDDDAPPPRPHRRRGESDEEVARKLHRAMNSSPRISFTGPKRPRGLVDAGEDGCRTEEGGGDACNGGSSTHTLTEVGGSVDGSSAGKSGERTAHFTKIRSPDDDAEESSWNAAKSTHIAPDNGSPSAGRKVKIKRKQLFLNHHDSKDREERKETEPSVDSAVGYDGLKSNGGAEKRPSFADARAAPAGDNPVPMKISSVWKFKKFKPSSSHCSSDSKMLHNVCSSSSAAEASAASVKAD